MEAVSRIRRRVEMPAPYPAFSSAGSHPGREKTGENTATLGRLEVWKELRTMERKDNFTQGAILPALTRFALPVLLALFLQAMYGAVDLQVVGNFGTAADISAVSTGSQILQTVTMVICGLAMGVTVLLGQRIGEGRGDEGGKAVGAGIFFFTILSLLVTVGMLILAPQLSVLMRAPEDAFAGTVEYVRICSVGMLFRQLLRHRRAGLGQQQKPAFALLGGIFRGIGDSRMPLITVAIACVLNIGGDLLLVGRCGLGVAGAAIATVLAQAVSVLLSLFIIRRRQLPFTMTRRDIRWDRAILRRVLAIGVPVAAQDFLVSISFLVIIAIANDMGTIPSAGVGVAEKLCAFVMLIPSAFAQSMTAFVAQNVGARRMDRAGRALLCGIGLSLAVSIVVFWGVFFHGDLLSGIFADDAKVILASAEYLKAYAIDCLLTSFLFSFIGYFNGCGRTVFTMLQGLTGAFCVRLPVAFLMNRYVHGSLFALGLSTPCSTVVQILLCGGYFLFLRRKETPQ